jgi:uncharacterized protein (TIGR00288 family)
MEAKRRLALMIDGDNAQEAAALLPQIMEVVSQQGIITIRCVYGDWSKSTMNCWKEVSHIYALRTEQQFSYTKGKNATDIALTIGAMDFLHKEEIDGFCIVSSDSDFTPLVNRIRENNLFVIGVGKKDTADAFRNACNIFVCIEDLKPATDNDTRIEIIKVNLPKEVTETVVKTPIDSKQFKALFKQAIASTPQEDGWAQLAVVGKHLQEIDPEYKRTYGIKGLSQLVESPPKFLGFKDEKNKKGNDVTYVRLKVNAKAEK